MSIGEVLPIVLVVVFWLAAFIFAWWFTARALRTPINYEEAHAADALTNDAHTHGAH